MIKCVSALCDADYFKGYPLKEIILVSGGQTTVANYCLLELRRQIKGWTILFRYNGEAL